MLVRELQDGSLVRFDAGRDRLDNGLMTQPNIEQLWSDDELAAVRLYKPRPFVTPDLRRAVGSPRYERIDGAVCEVYATEPVSFSDGDVTRERDARIAAGHAITLSDGRSFTVDTRDERDFRNINGLVSKAIVMTLMQDQGTLIIFRDADNEDRELTPAQMIELGSLIAGRVDAIYKASWRLKDGEAIPLDYRSNQHWPA